MWIYLIRHDEKLNNKAIKLTPRQWHQVSSADRNLQRSGYPQSVDIERARKTPLCSISQVLTMATVFGKQISLDAIL